MMTMMMMMSLGMKQRNCRHKARLIDRIIKCRHRFKMIMLHNKPIYIPEFLLKPTRQRNEYYDHGVFLIPAYCGD